VDRRSRSAPHSCIAIPGRLSLNSAARGDLRTTKHLEQRSRVTDSVSSFLGSERSVTTAKSSHKWLPSSNLSSTMEVEAAEADLVAADVEVEVITTTATMVLKGEGQREACSPCLQHHPSNKLRPTLLNLCLPMATINNLPILITELKACTMVDRKECLRPLSNSSSNNSSNNLPL